MANLIGFIYFFLKFAPFLTELNFEIWSMGFKDIPLLECKQQTGFEDISDDDFINNVLKKNHPKIVNTLKIFYSGGL